MLVVSEMISLLVNPSSGAPTRSIINARDAQCFTGGHSHVLSLCHIILIRLQSLYTTTGRNTGEETKYTCVISYLI